MGKTWSNILFLIKAHYKA